MRQYSKYLKTVFYWWQQQHYQVSEILVGQGYEILCEVDHVALYSNLQSLVFEWVILFSSTFKGCIVLQRERIVEKGRLILIEICAVSCKTVLLSVTPKKINSVQFRSTVLMLPHLQVKNKALQTIVKILQYTPAESLTNLLEAIPISSFTAGLFSSQEPTTTAAALRTAELLQIKLPKIFTSMLLKEGVVHAIESLSSEAPAPPPEQPKTRRSSSRLKASLSQSS